MAQAVRQVKSTGCAYKFLKARITVKCCYLLCYSLLDKYNHSRKINMQVLWNRAGATCIPSWNRWILSTSGENGGWSCPSKRRHCPLSMETFQKHASSNINAKCVTGVLVSVFSCVFSVFQPTGLRRPVGSDTHQHAPTQSHPRLTSFRFWAICAVFFDIC